MGYFKEIPEKTKGLLFFILTCFLVSVMVSIVRKVTIDFHPLFAVFMRNLFGLIFFVPMIIKEDISFFKTKKPNLHFFRGLSGLFGMVMWFSAIKEIALPELISFTFLVPIMTTFAAMLIFKEDAGKNIWVALFVGFIGILFITRPGFRDLNIFYLFALSTTFSWSATNLLIKKMTKTEKSRLIAFYMTLIMFIFSIPFAFLYYQELNFVDLLWFAALGLVSNLSHISMSHAFSKVDLTFLQPFDFLRLVFVSIIAYFAFDEVLDLFTFIGAAIIMVGVIFALPRKKKGKGDIIEIID